MGLDEDDVVRAGVESLRSLSIDRLGEGERLAYRVEMLVVVLLLAASGLARRPCQDL